MKTIHAVYEQGVFRPLDDVELPQRTEVAFEPRPVEPPAAPAKGLQAIHDVLVERGTVAKIVEAVRQLSPAEQSDLVIQLEPILLGAEVDRPAAGRDYTTPEFTARLQRHFHAAKRAALARSPAA